MIKFFMLCLVVAGCFFFFKDKRNDIALPQGTKSSLMYAGFSEQNLSGSFNAKNYSVKGLTNILVLATRECPSCKSLKMESQSFLTRRPDLAIKFLYMPYTTWASHHSEKTYGVKVNAVPHTIIVDPDGNILAEDTPPKREGTTHLYNAMRNKQ